MEVIAGAASVSQLVAYSFSSIRYLQQLYTELNTGDSVYRNEEKNVGLLLGVIKRLTDQNIQDTDPILPILIDISGLACEILSLLLPKRRFGYNWTALTAQNKIKAAFETLDKKQKLLQLYMLQANNDALFAIRTIIDQQSIKPLSCTSTMNSRPAITVERNFNESYLETGSGHEAALQSNHNDSTILTKEVVVDGNRAENSEATRLKVQRREVELARARLTASNTPP
ncbi:hypothetical protein CC86DRAFT_404855 [Ophiobolus disseminans]|uniref:Fungal N-terminal domain-containing protein n=1 Tax=Ophiobolus disseminans TaxID=1469910 RepID=A0A6A7A3B5_9PLEO|nr:hypothetical protein CC86DRAFT_404855 [Ophiobolus disseminans]